MGLVILHRGPGASSSRLRRAGSKPGGEPIESGGYQPVEPGDTDPSRPGHGDQRTANRDAGSAYPHVSTPDRHAGPSYRDAFPSDGHPDPGNGAILAE